MEHQIFSEYLFSTSFTAIYTSAYWERIPCINFGKFLNFIVFSYENGHLYSVYYYFVGEFNVRIGSSFFTVKVGVFIHSKRKSNSFKSYLHPVVASNPHKSIHLIYLNHFEPAKSIEFINSLSKTCLIAVVSTDNTNAV